MEKDCVFCQIANHMAPAQIIYEDEEVVCLLDHDPINVGHVLIVPVKHYLDADDCRSLPPAPLCGCLQKLPERSKKFFTGWVQYHAGRGRIQ